MAEPQRQIEVQLGHLCNNRCVFCVSGQLSEQRRAPQLPVDPIADQIRQARDNGATKITFLGGEPTIQRSFLGLLQLAVDLDFDEIVIFTNGVMTPRESFRERVERVLSGLGPRVRERVIWRFSLQGGDAEHHDATTINPGAWDRIQRSMRTLHSEGARVTGNMCVVEQNYRSVHKLAEVAATYDFENLHLDMVRPRDSGDRTDDELRAMMARYSDMAPYFRQLVSRCEEEIGPHFDLNIGNMPYCVAPDISHRIHHDGQFTVTVAASGQGTTQVGFNKYLDKRSDKLKTAGCGDCVFDAQCGGIFEKYEEFHGLDEFQPVTSDQLWRLPNHASHFVLLAEPAVRTWLSSGRGTIARVHEREGFIDVSVKIGDAEVSLRLSAARELHAQAWCVWRGARLSAHWLGAPPERAHWADLHQTLSSLALELGGRLEAFDEAAFADAWRAHRAGLERARALHVKGRRRVMAWVEKLRRVALADLPFHGIEQLPPAGVTLVWGDAEQGIELDLLVDDAGGRPRLRHRARGLSDAQIASFNREMARALRSERPSAHA